MIQNLATQRNVVGQHVLVAGTDEIAGVVAQAVDVRANAASGCVDQAIAQIITTAHFQAVHALQRQSGGNSQISDVRVQTDTQDIIAQIKVITGGQTTDDIIAANTGEVGADIGIAKLQTGIATGPVAAGCDSNRRGCFDHRLHGCGRSRTGECGCCQRGSAERSNQSTCRFHGPILSLRGRYRLGRASPCEAVRQRSRHK